MRDKLCEILDKIYNDIEDNKSISLMVGGTGISLFKLYYLKHIKNNNLNDNIINNIQELSEASINNYNSKTFCSGQAGINWFFTLLYKEKYIEKSDYEIICHNNLGLVKASLDYLAVNNYDFLHGGVGIAHYILYVNNKKFTPYFSNFLANLTLIMDQGSLVHYDFERQIHDRSKINPSLSHGLSSILKFCMQCYTKDICKKQSKKLAERIIDFLTTNLNSDKSHSYYPSVYDNDSIDQKSRLSWCYGDLTIAYIMYQYSIVFKNEQVKNLAIEILHHSAKRRTEQDSGVTDVGFCHGSSGIAYIFSKLWYNTKDLEFYEASMYWYQKTIEHSIYKDGIGGYKKFDYAERSFVNDSGLLEGAAGIGLSILSHVFEDYSWDYCLMLND